MHRVRETQFWGSAFFCSCVAFPAFAQNLATGTGIEIPYARIAAGLIICFLIAFAAALVIRNLRIHQNFGGGVAQDSRPSFAFWGMAQLGAGLKEKLGNFPGEIRVLETRKLTPIADICRVLVDGETIVLAITQGAIIVLYRQSAFEDAASNQNSDGPKAVL